MIWIQSNSLKELTVHIKQVSRDEPKMLCDRSKHLKKMCHQWHRIPEFYASGKNPTFMQKNKFYFHGAILTDTWKQILCNVC